MKKIVAKLSKFVPAVLVGIASPALMGEDLSSITHDKNTGHFQWASAMLNACDHSSHDFSTLPVSNDTLSLTAQINNAAHRRTVLQITETDLQTAIEDLDGHIDSSQLLTAAELYAVRDTIAGEKEDGILTSSVSLLETAYATIQRYENIHGALFTPAGTQTFNLADSDTDGRALERTMHSLYLAVFDAIDADRIASDTDIIDGLAFGSASYFPGDVGQSANPSTVHTVEINASVPEDWGRPNLYSTLPARRPTGTYLTPGAIAEITVPAALINKGYQVRVGAHSWDLSAKSSQRRLARATKLFPITSTLTRVANPLGGNVYIEVPHLADDGMVEVSIANVVTSPYFSARDVDRITEAQWEAAERAAPGPWTDIETDRVMMSVPSKWVRDFSFADMMEILNEYDTHMDLISDYMGKPHIRNKPSIFMQVDVIFRGSAFYPGYPMSNYPSFTSDTPQSPLVSGHAFDQTMLHEHGHATYMTKFTTNERESIVHMLYPYIATQLYGLPLEESFSNSLAYAKSTDRTMDDVFISWALRDEFINDIDMGFPNAAYKHRGHADHIQYVELFGWSALTEFNRKLNVDFVETGFDFHRNEHENNDRLLRLSREAGVDVRPLFHLWGHSPNNEATLQAALNAENLSPSAEIYDLMVAFKSTIPFTQADYDGWYTRMSAVLFSGHRTEFWDPLAESYDTGRAQNAVDRIDQLLTLYYPDGRPASAPVTMYQDENFGGASWQLATGAYDINSIRASVVGNDSISSIRIQAGYQATLCQHNVSNTNNGGLCETYTSSAAQLGALNNQTSYINVLAIPDSTVVDAFPKDFQLFPRDTVTNTASVTVSGVAGSDTSETLLNVYRDGALWSSLTHSRAESSAFQFRVDLPAELANYNFELLSTDAVDNQTIIATADSVVAGDVFVINGQSNAVSGIYSASDSSTEDSSDFIRTYGGWGTDTWNDNDDWHIVRAECRPLSQPLACVGRWGLRFAAELQSSIQIPVAVINQGRGGQAINYFAANTGNVYDLTTNYGQLLTRLENGGVADNIRALFWYQGESDRLDNQAHFDQFPALYNQWQAQYPSIDQYYVFQIRHTCVPNDEEFGQGSQISNFQRDFANARDNVTPVSTTGLDAHDGCHFGYQSGYQQIGDNVARMVEDKLYDGNLSNADAADIVVASRIDDTTLALTFTEGNTLVADDGFEALFELRDSFDTPYNISAGVVHSDAVVRLTVDRVIQEGDQLQLSYLSLSGNQNWLTNEAGIGILSFLDFPVDTSADPLLPVEPPPPVDPLEPADPVSTYGVDTDQDGVPDTIEVAENTDPSSDTSFRDSDNDNVADFSDPDSDGDGNWNLFEPGSFPYYDRDGDAVPAYLDDDDYNKRVGDNNNAVEALFDADNNGTADFSEVATNNVDRDSDGVPDIVEAVDNTVATDASSFLDFDNDTIPDYLDEDDDNDGIPDIIEGSSDADQDGIANQFDTDSDGDGVSDTEEGTADLNGDALPNFLDPATTTTTAAPDRDNDGIADAVDGSQDTDLDGIANQLDTDSDGDGLTDLIETNADFDGDGIPNFLDNDSDADGISDQLEGMADGDNDSYGNAVDPDSDADTIPDSIELADDPDADGIPNYLDSDSDGDGVADLLETAADFDGDGIPDYLDNNNADPGDSAPLLTTGTGCVLAGTAGTPDPSLLFLLLSAFVMLWRRRRVA